MEKQTFFCPTAFLYLFIQGGIKNKSWYLQEFVC